MINRCAFVTGVGAVLDTPVAVVAQPADKVAPLGVLSPPDSHTTIDVIRRNLRDLRCIKGDGMQIESVRVELRAAADHGLALPAPGR